MLKQWNLLGANFQNRLFYKIYTLIFRLTVVLSERKEVN